MTVSARPWSAPRDVLVRLQELMTACGVTAHVVGGAVRDALLDRETAVDNVDVTVPPGALRHVQGWAAELSGAFVPLDDTFGTARLVVPHARGRVTVDVSEWRGPTLEADLARRDFTINALAVRLDDWLRDPRHPAPLVDPTGGQDALRQRTLRPCFAGAFEEDPLRILRAWRLAAALELRVDAAAEPLMQAACAGLSRVSGERIREELLTLLATDRAGEGLEALDRTGALDRIVPELAAGRAMDQGGFHHLDVLGHQLEAVRQADRVLKDFAEFSEPLRAPLAAYCAETPVAGRARKGLIKLGVLLHDVGKPANRQVHDDGEIWFIGHEHGGADLTAGIVERLRLARREADLVCQLVRHHLRPGFLSREPELTRRAIYRFYKDLGEHGPACLLTWWCDRMATRGPKSRLDQLDAQRARLEELLRPYFVKPEDVVRPRRLVTGHDLMETFQVPSGPLIGVLLDRIEEAQAEGSIRDRDEALALARRHLADARAAQG